MVYNLIYNIYIFIFNEYKLILKFIKYILLITFILITFILITFILITFILIIILFIIIISKQSKIARNLRSRFYL